MHIHEKKIFIRTKTKKTLVIENYTDVKSYLSMTHKNDDIIVA